MLEECYWSQLKQLPRQQWAEYFDGPTGTWVGQQARTYQTWTIVGFLLMHHMLRVRPQDVSLLDIEPSVRGSRSTDADEGEDLLADTEAQ
jgi:beta-fructofuranosidase